jgi:hypothetical protein
VLVAAGKRVSAFVVTYDRRQGAAVAPAGIPVEAPGR